MTTADRKRPGGRPSHRDKVRRDAEYLPGSISVIRNDRAPTAYAPADLIRMCREETVDNVRILKEMRDDADVPAAVRACAISILFDRAYGKAPQMIAIADVTPPQGIDLSRLSVEEMLVIERLLRKASGSETETDD